MGYASRGSCYADFPSAAADACSAYPTSFNVGTDAYTLSCAGVSSDSSSLNLIRTATSVSSPPQAMTLAVSFPTCDAMAPYTDLSIVWGLGLLALAPLSMLASIFKRFLRNQ